jgi:hypothetical protein
MKDHLNFNTKKEGMQKLREYIDIRNQMMGGLYWCILSNKCNEIKNKLYKMEGKNVSKLEKNRSNKGNL